MAAISTLARRQLSWMLLTLVITVGWSFQPAQAHHPHDVVTQIKLSPNYSRDQTVYTLVHGNLLKSVDAGNHWKRLVQGLNTLAPFSTLTLDQADGQLLALGTHGDGIFLSDDRGESWRQTNDGLDTLDIGLVYSLPSNPQVMLAAGAKGGLFRSIDRGQSWFSVADSSQLFLALGEAKGTVWAGDKTGQLLRSSDSGQNWQSLLRVANDPITTIANNGKVVYVGTASQGLFRLNPETLEIIEVNKGLEDLRIQDVKILPGDSRGVIVSSWNQGISISLDGGATWTDYPQGLNKDKQADEFATHHFSEIAVSDDFITDKTVFLGGFNGLYKSIKSGQQWREINSLDQGIVVAMDISPNYGDDGTIALTSYVGKILLSHDRGKTWQLAMNGAEVPRLNGNFEPFYQDPRRFFDIEFSPDYTRDKTLFTTSLWTKVLRSTNGAKSWSLPTLSQEAQGLTLLFSPDFGTDQTIYIGDQTGILFRSIDGGKTFESIAELPWKRGNDGPSMVISPDFAKDRTLYMVAETGVYKSTDAGEHWQSTTESSPISTAKNLHIELSPSYSQDKTLYVSSYNGLYKTIDAGESWQSVEIANVAPNRAFLEGVALSPNYAEDGTVMVSLRGKGLYKSTDKGASFTSVGDASLAFARMDNVPSAGRPIIFSPNYANDNTIFGFGTANTDIYQSTDGGETWEILETPDVEPSVDVSTMTKVAISAELYRDKILRLSLSVAIAITASIAVGILRLDKIINLNRRLLQFGTAMGSFTMALAILLKV
ncbi:MAG: YCF48-related protein [Cyanobacteria bacterium P01_H01_bin.105]